MKGNKGSDIFRFILIVAIIIVINWIGTLKFFRIDLTAENRFSLSDATINMLEKVEDVLLVKIYLEGDFPADFQRLQRETRQMLDEFRAYNSNIQYEFINPDEADDPKLSQEIKQQLQFKGIRPYNVQVKEKGGSQTTEIFPGAIMNYGDRETSVMLLQEQFAANPQVQINNSIQNLEFALANGIRGLIAKNKPRIGFLYGHDELEARHIADFALTLSENYEVSRFNIQKFRSDSLGQQVSVQDQMSRVNSFDMLIVAKPRTAFSDLDKYLLDQFIMHGGKVIWLIDAVHAEMDSLSVSSQFISYPILDRLRISDMLFRYGVRINTNLVQDLISAGVSDGRTVNSWIYFPLVMPQVQHPITKDLNAIMLQFPSSMDTIISKDVKKTVLLRSSPYTALSATPHIVRLARLREEHDERRFPAKHVPLGIMLEGEFESVFKNRLLPRDESQEQLTLREKSVQTQMLVVADGDIIRNQLNVVNPGIPKGTPLPLGHDQFTGQTYGNKDFLLNAVDYMLDDSGLISIRSRELKMRLLNPQKIANERLQWQLLNTLLPVLLIIITGLILNLYRKKKYAK